MLTALRSGRYVVSVNGTDVSSHTTEREAIEAAMNLDADLVQYRHEYTVQVKKGPKKNNASSSLSGGVIVMNAE